MIYGKNGRVRNYNKILDMLYSTTAYIADKLIKVSWIKYEPGNIPGLYLKSHANRLIRVALE